MFALMNTGVFYSGHILKELFHETRTHYGLLAVLAFFKYNGAFAGLAGWQAVAMTCPA